MKPIPASARVVVIGGGIGGCSAAYHLARMGVREVVLLERSMLSSGTTWHSTGNMETYRDDPLVFDMVRYAAECYPRLAQESGLEVGWRNVGRVMFTDSAERWARMCTLPELGRARGIDIELMTPEQAQARLPILATEGLVGAVWIPGDARVNPTDAVMAFAAAARHRGVAIHQDVRVLGLELQGGAVRGVVTDGGTISCDTVVMAAGLWSAAIVQGCGLQLPLYALEHQYLVTQALAIDRNLPLFLSYDDQLYGREEVGGLMVGSLDDRAIPLSAAELPQGFSYALLNERWEQFEPYMRVAMRRFPLLRTAEIKMLLNGPESFTPDGHMLLGPVPGASGLYAACGFNSNGMALAPAAGRFIAEWIVAGEPSADVAPLDVRRFSPQQASETFLRERVTEIPGYHCRLHGLDDDYSTSRDIRHSPLHAQLQGCGARFVSVNGWERPHWFADGGETQLLAAVAAEVRAAENSLLLVDRSSDVKYLLGGAGVREWFGQQLGVPLPTEAKANAATVLLAGNHGQVEILAQLLAWEAGQLLLVAGPEQEVRLAEWLRRAAMPAGCSIADVSAQFALLEMYGPRRFELGDMLATGGSAASRAAVRIRADDLREVSLGIVPPAEAAGSWQQLLEAGSKYGARPGGYLACEALRTMRGIPGFGREATPARLIRELQSVSAVPAGDQVPQTHSARALVALAGPIAVDGFGAREVVLQNDQPVGELTTRVRLPGWPEALGLALLKPDACHGEAFEVVVSGCRWPMARRSSHWQSTQGD